VRLGLTVCYDVRFPELYRLLVDQGARIVTVPAAFTLTTGKDHWHALLRARAIENQVYVLAPAQHGLGHDDGAVDQNAEIDRVCRAYPHLQDDAFVQEHLDEWLR